ncbi:hypothetical protein GKJPGBOP_02162 [Streptomyces paromomycinus]|uniref:DUF3291 domain-containing protein n=1 Tax=Streptomyces paromomycinus TaxID=92743 RepID=A0A401VZJ1_STREY|nr:hypothetical protein GKJPGBOP_02162 [Streptomyces paromomycinus]
MGRENATSTGPAKAATFTWSSAITRGRTGVPSGRATRDGTSRSPLTHELHDSDEVIYQKISQHPGYLARAEATDGARGTPFDLDRGDWGEFVVPTWYGKGRTTETTTLAVPLSLWTDLRPAFGATYTGLHREALNRRYDWSERTGHPAYVFW